MSSLALQFVLPLIIGRAGIRRVRVEVTLMADVAVR